MMTANELRLGNYVLQHRNNKISAIISINKYGECTLDNAGFLKFTPQVGILPIPLTEQWLKDFGFKVERIKKGSIAFVNFWTKGDFEIQTWSADESGKNKFRFFVNDFQAVVLEHVHHLQNLHFDLVRTELIRK